MRRKIRFITPGRRVAARDYWFGIANGVLFTLAEALSDANLVLALFIRELGGPLTLVGLLPSLKNGGWLLPQLVAAGRLQARRLVLPVYRKASIARVIAWSALTATIFFAPELGRGPALWLFLLFYAAYNLGGGASGLAFQVVVAKVIPPSRRGSFFGYRNLLGGLLAFFIAGPLVRTLISQGSPLPFPYNYSLLMAVALICIAVGLFAFNMVREPAAEEVGQRETTRAMLSHIPRLLRGDAHYRRFIVVRLLGRLGMIADPFYIIYALEVLHVPAQMVGVYLATRTISAALSNLLWGRIADRQGIQRLLVLTSRLTVAVPVMALALPFIAWLFNLHSIWLGWAFGVVFLLIGLTVDGSATAGLTYLMELASPADRPRYIGVSNTLLGIATFLPVLGGILVDLVQYEGLFAIAALASFTAWRMALLLPEPRALAEKPAEPPEPPEPTEPVIEQPHVP
ncbi:MAG: MFS transporter [Herpetosiphonaceae bacterium]|nr:MAG: MFS transporter [Herpetosiphonaceae bacterium]